MKKIILTTISLLLFSTLCNAKSIPDFAYKQIKPKDKIVFDADTETWKYAKKSDNYLVNSADFENYSSYIDKNGNLVFATNCTFEFIQNNKLTGYSEDDFSFYDLKLKENELIKTKLHEEDLKTLFPKYKIIKLSEFSPNTQSIRLKKGLGKLKLIIFNDKDTNLTEYKFSSGDAKFKTYPISSIITVTKPGMIQFSKAAEAAEEETEENNKKDYPWYVILVK